jgi:hypothetical protein
MNYGILDFFYYIRYQVKVKTVNRAGYAARNKEAKTVCEQRGLFQIWQLTLVGSSNHNPGHSLLAHAFTRDGHLLGRSS